MCFYGMEIAYISMLDEFYKNMEGEQIWEKL